MSDLLKKEKIISTAVVLKEQNSNTRIAYFDNKNNILGKGYDTSSQQVSKKRFSTIDEAKNWVHEIVPENGSFTESNFSKDHFDNVGSNRRDFEEMWKIHHEPKEIVQLLNGSETYFDRVIGYCAFHKRYITRTQIKTKKCLQKCCPRLIKIENSFWKDRDTKQVEKKIRRALDII